MNYQLRGIRSCGRPRKDLMLDAEDEDGKKEKK
jgi:hypothetical protein